MHRYDTIVGSMYILALGMVLLAGLVDEVALAMPEPVAALSVFNQSSGQFEMPILDLSNHTVALMVEEQLNISMCNCTESGYSGVMVAANRTIISYGNTTRVGCAQHDMDGEQSVMPDSLYCYVLGGTGCADATPSMLGNKNASFTMAAYRECTPLAEKSFLSQVGETAQNAWEGVQSWGASAWESVRSWG